MRVHLQRALRLGRRRRGSRTKLGSLHRAPLPPVRLARELAQATVGVVLRRRHQRFRRYRPPWRVGERKGARDGAHDAHRGGRRNSQAGRRRTHVIRPQTERHLPAHERQTVKRQHVRKDRPVDRGRRRPAVVRSRRGGRVSGFSTAARSTSVSAPPSVSQSKSAVTDTVASTLRSRLRMTLTIRPCHWQQARIFMPMPTRSSAAFTSAPALRCVFEWGENTWHSAPGWSLASIGRCNTVAAYDRIGTTTRKNTAIRRPVSGMRNRGRRLTAVLVDVLE
jgi:hypothetical protein